MSTLSKSPIRVARAALAVATKALRPYAHKYSPKRYTQPQLFVCLVLKTFFKTDYRGLTTYLTEWAELRRTLGLRGVPHFTTLQKASCRLLRLPRARRLLTATIRRHLKRRRSVRRVAFGSTGLRGVPGREGSINDRADGGDKKAAQQVRVPSHDGNASRTF